MINILTSAILILAIAGLYTYIKVKIEQRKKIPFNIRYEKRD